MPIRKQNIPILLSYSIVITLFIVTINNSYFYDTIYYGSKLAEYYYITNLSFRLPDSIECGYFPTFGMYIALIWKVLGRDLVSSHLAMLPFIIGIIWQLERLIRKFVPRGTSGLALLIILIDPTLLSQMTLVSPDVLLIFFFILGLNSVLENKRILISIAIIFLFLIHMRGIIISFCILLIDIHVNISFSNSIKKIIVDLIKRSIIYLPAFFIFLAFSYYHYITKGWILFHYDSPWAELFQKVGFKRIIYNIGIIGWRIIDFGRIGIWIVFFILLFRLRKDILKSKKTLLLFFIFSVLLILLTASLVWAKNLLAHRYLLPVYLCFSLLCANILFNHPVDFILKRTLIYVWIIILISGNFWVYPDRIDKGWDSTLAHLPYFNMRKQAIEYLDEQEINYENVQSFYPNTTIIDYLDLNFDNRSFSNFNDSCDYVIYSNVFNIKDEDYDLIKTQYVIIKHFNRGLVYLDICKKIIPKR